MSNFRMEFPDFDYEPDALLSDPASWEDVRAFIEDGKRHFPDYVRREG